MNSPSCFPDVDSILSAAIGNVIQEGLGGLLDRVLGTGAESEIETTTTDAESNTEPADPAEEILNNVLDSLFR